METNFFRRSRSTSLVSITVLGLGILGFATGAKGVVILPGQLLAPAGTDSLVGDVPLADTGSESFSGVDGSSNVVFTGTLDSSVDFDSGTGGLDFVYQLSNNANSLDAIARLTASGFAGFTTDADYVSGTGAAPFLVSRTSDGDTIGFNFPSSAPVSQGQSSDILVIKTNATKFQAGTVSVQDGGNANVDSYAPLAVPEPATAAIAVLGLGGLVLRPRKNTR
jgi:hypothetical protein